MTVVFPGESAEYRAARNRLLEQEIELRRAMEAVAAARRQLPPGGAVPQDYVFETQGPLGRPTISADQTTHRSHADDIVGRLRDQIPRRLHLVAPSWDGSQTANHADKDLPWARRVSRRRRESAASVAGSAVAGCSVAAQS